MAKSIRKPATVPADVTAEIKQSYYPERAALILKLMTTDRMSRRDAITWSRRQMKKSGAWWA